MSCETSEKNFETIGRYTSPTLTIEVPIDLREANVYVTFKQNDVVVLEKTNDEITVDASKIVIPLSQEDTSHFSRGLLLFQVRYVFVDGTSDFSYPLATSVIDAYKEGVLEYV